MTIKQGFSILLTFLFGAVLNTIIAAYNGLAPCEIYGLCQSDLIDTNEMLLGQVQQLKQDLITAYDSTDQQIESMNRQLEKEQQHNQDIRTAIEKIVAINQGDNTSENIREIAKQIVEVAALLDQSNTL